MFLCFQNTGQLSVNDDIHNTKYCEAYKPVAYEYRDLKYFNMTSGG